MKKYYQYILISIITLLLLLLAIDNYGIWTDEAYTLNMIKHPILNIPFIENKLDGNAFYMLLLKIYISLFNVNTPKEIIVFARLFSIIPIILLLVIGYYKISKLYTEKHGLAFIIILFVSNIIFYSIEIRVYSWTILFVTLAFIDFLYINNSCRTRNWILFTIESSLAFWFHKIAVIPLAILYIQLFFKTLKNKKIKVFINYFILTILICIPWILWSFYVNKDAIHESYVAGAIGRVFTYSKITETIIFPFDTGNLYISLLFILIIFIVFIKWILANYKKIDKLITVGIFVLPITVLVLMVIAYASNHDYYPKYMLPSLGIFYTCVSIIIASSDSFKKILFVIIFINLFTYYNILSEEIQSKEGFKKLEEYVNNGRIVEENIIFSFDYGKYIVDYYQFNGLKDKKLEWNKEYIKKNDALYMIQTYKLNEYFIDENGNEIQYEIIETFNISNDFFSLCKVIVQ